MVPEALPPSWEKQNSRTSEITPETQGTKLQPAAPYHNFAVCFLQKMEGYGRFLTILSPYDPHDRCTRLGGRDGSVVRALAFNQCGPGRFRPDAICGLSCLLVSSLLQFNVQPTGKWIEHISQSRRALR